MEYDTETLQTTHYFTRWQIRLSPLDYDTEILQTTHYSLLWRIRHSQHGIWHWDSTDYQLLYSMIGRSKPVRLWNWESTDYPLLYTMTDKTQPLIYDTETLQTKYYSTQWQISPCLVRLWHWDSTDYPLLYTITDKVQPTWNITLRLYRLPTTLQDDR